MDLTIEKLQRRIPEIAAAAVRAVRPIAPVLACPAPGAPAQSAMAAPPDPADPVWRPLRVGERWGLVPGADPDAAPRMLAWNIPADGGSNHWLRAELRVPAEWRDRSLRLAMAWQLAGHNNPTALEAILYLDGAALAGLDEFHTSAALPAAAHAGAHELLLRCFLPYAQPFGGLALQLRDETIFQLAHTMRALLEAARTYRESDPALPALLAALQRAYQALDLRQGYQSDAFAASAQAAFAELQAAIAGWSQPPNLAIPQPPTMIATGHAHLDVAWLWPLWRTRQKVAHTVATALRLIDLDPDYHFSMSQPQVYAYLKQDDPQLYARLREQIAAGRFEPVGVMWLEPDCNVPSGESLVRQIVHGARFFGAEFGVQHHSVWLPDVFGYAAALPQLMRLAGISCFMTTKISWSQTNRMPSDTFRWRGIDGSEVLAHFVTATDQPLKHPADPQFYTYVGNMSGGELFGTWNHYRQKPLNPELLYIYGWGDGGGGPTEEMLVAARAMRALPGFPQLRPGRVDAFFERLYARLWEDPRLPTWVGELYLEFHRGTYTSQARTKQQNRAAELQYRAAEWLSAWASLGGAPARQAELDAGWQLLLLNQFHDILPGSSIRLVYADSDAQFAEVRRIGAAVTSAALADLLGPPPASPDAPAQHYAVVNSLPWERRELLAIPLPAGAAMPVLSAAAAAPLLSQLVEEADGSRTLLVEAAAPAPAYGYSTLAAVPTDDRAATQDDRPRTQAEERPQKSPEPARLVASRTLLENAALRVELDANGEIASLYDKEHRRELAQPGATLNQLVAYEDRPLNWDAWDIDPFYLEKPYPLREISGWELAEQGPLRAAIAIVRQLGRSTITQRIGLWRDGRRLDFVTTVEWQERQTLLRALFPLAINTDKATCEIQFGAVERPTHRNTSWDQARFEVCAQRWVDLGEGGYGLALLNDGKYGHSLHGATLGLSLLKGAVFPDPEADSGRHRFTYSLYPHSGDWRAAQVVRRAYELNAPLLAAPRAMPTPGRPARAALLSTDCDHILVETIKAADDGDGLIVRLYEAHNQRGKATLRFDRPVSSAEQVDLLERPLGVLAVDGPVVHLSVRPFEVQTLRVRLAAAQ